ncbi:MAG TPA: biotin/lipoyl-containing protein, partial [Pirellulales bacterium]
PADFAAKGAELEKLLGRAPSTREILSYLMFPRVATDYIAHEQKYGDTSVLPTPLFLYGPQTGDETNVDIERGKRLIIKFLTIGDPQPDGRRTVFFELNGQPRQVAVLDRAVEGVVSQRPKADPQDPLQVAAPMPGVVVTVAVQEGDTVATGQKLVSMEAMKMETTLYADRDAKVAQVLVRPGVQVDTGDLLVKLAEGEK